MKSNKNHIKGVMQLPSDEALISFAMNASDPFQFIAKVLCKDAYNSLNRVPITQDASASAYQIMSYLLLNEEMAMRTNLLPDEDGNIQDVYTYLLNDFKLFIQERMEETSIREIIISLIDRKLVKLLFMPRVYGKTMISMERDIRKKFGSLLSIADSFTLAKLTNEFWKYKYPDIVNFMKLISTAGYN